MAGKAEFLVTGDRDLRDVGRAMPVTVLSPRQFWTLLRETNPE